jgi:hypothetical protein
MNNLIELLRKTLSEKGLSPERACHYIGCSGNEIRRWFKGISKPTPLYQKAIKEGIEKIKREEEGGEN